LHEVIVMILPDTVRSVAVMLAATFGSTPVDAAVRTVHIAATDDMKFSVSEIVAEPNEPLRIVLGVKGTAPKIAMAHNVVFLKKGTNVEAFINASSNARDTGFVAPALSSQVLAATALAGAGETVTVTFTAPSQRGRYTFVCSFPGHYASGMRGVLIVE
jgi:azurin